MKNINIKKISLKYLIFLTLIFSRRNLFGMDYQETTIKKEENVKSKEFLNEIELDFKEIQNAFQAIYNKYYSPIKNTFENTEINHRNTLKNIFDIFDIFYIFEIIMKKIQNMNHQEEFNKKTPMKILNTCILLKYEYTNIDYEETNPLLEDIINNGYKIEFNIFLEKEILFKVIEGIDWIFVNTENHKDKKQDILKVYSYVLKYLKTIENFIYSLEDNNLKSLFSIIKNIEELLINKDNAMEISNIIDPLKEQYNYLESSFFLKNIISMDIDNFCELIKNENIKNIIDKDEYEISIDIDKFFTKIINKILCIENFVKEKYNSKLSSLKEECSNLENSKLSSLKEKCSNLKDNTLNFMEVYTSKVRFLKTIKRSTDEIEKKIKKFSHLEEYTQHQDFIFGYLEYLKYFEEEIKEEEIQQLFREL